MSLTKRLFVYRYQWKVKPLNTTTMLDELMFGAFELQKVNEKTSLLAALTQMRFLAKVVISYLILVSEMSFLHVFYPSDYVGP